MSVRAFALIATTLLVMPISGSVLWAQSAQQQTGVPPRRVAHPHIEINPRPLLYRRCTDWYVLQDRPSGTVLFPQQHCWWVRG